MILLFWTYQGTAVVDADGTLVATATSADLARRISALPDLTRAAERLYHACELEDDPAIENARLSLGNALDHADGIGHEPKK